MRKSNEIVNEIKRLREARGWSLEDLARRVGLSKSTLSRYESGQRQFPINDIGKFADVLDVSIEHLLGLRKQTDLVPLVGTICAGDGLLAEQNIEDYVQYPFRGGSQPDFALRVRGNSMIGAGIEDGDIVYMRHAQWADYNGQIVAALINDQTEGTLKRIRWSSETPKISLIPENDEYETIECMPNEITICGVYMGHFKPDKGV